MGEIKLTTGNKIVDKVSQINFQGDITPRIWRKTITKANGKPYPLARDILSDLVYWYRAYEVVDEHTQEVRIKKKFSDDLLYRSYKQLMDEFGESKRVIRDALRRLEEIGVVKCHYKTVVTDNGMVLNNVMYIELIPDVLRSLTYPNQDAATVEKTEPKSVEAPKNKEPLPPSDENVTRGNKERKEDIKENLEEKHEEMEADIKTDLDVTEKLAKPTKNREPLPPSDENVTRVVTKMSPRSTKSSTENKTFNKSNLSYPSTEKNSSGEVNKADADGMDKTKQMVEIFVKNATEFDNMAKDTGSSEQSMWRCKERLKKNFLAQLSPDMNEDVERYPLSFVKTWFDYPGLLLMAKSQDDIETVITLIHDTINTNQPTIRIAGEEKPTAIVTSKLLKLDASDILYALNKFHEQTTRIRNQRSYLLTVLYVAKEQNQLDVSNQVMHDMYGERGEAQ